MNLRTIAVALTAGLILTAATHGAHAQDRAACLAAVDKGQGLRDEGKLLQAREQFLVCANQACPATLVAQCTEWLDQAGRDIPSIVFRVKDATGTEALDAKVYLNGRKDALVIQSSAVQMDPGPYSASVMLRDGTTFTDKFLLRSGERNKIIEMTAPVLVAKSPPAQKKVEIVPSKPASTFHIPAYAWVGVGVGVLGAVGTGVFAAGANSGQTDLENSKCAPRCDESKRSSIESNVTLANVSMIAGGVGFGFAIVSTIVANLGSNEAASPPAAALAKSLRARRPSVAVAPTENGVFASCSGSF